VEQLYQRGSSPIHRMDARVRLLLALGFILSLSLAPVGALPAYVLYLSAAATAVRIAGLSYRWVLKRSLIALPFALAAAPLVFTGPSPLEQITLWSDFQIAVSPAGAVRFASIALKSWISVQAAIVLSATTSLNGLLSALRDLRLPPLLISVIGLMLRYLFVIRDEALRLLRARSSRSALLPIHQPPRRPGGSIPWRAKQAGGMAGSLFLRSLERSERVHSAMLARGYNGLPPTAPAAPLTSRQTKTLLLGLVTAALLLLISLLTA
jgi:cobalt/nickel transport system permease protein